MPVEALKCKECGTEYALEARYVCERCFGPLEVALRLLRRSTPTSRQAPDPGRPAEPLALRRLPAVRARSPGTRCRPACTPLVARRPARRAARPARGVGQERRRQPDPLVQGPRGDGRARQGARARLRGRRLRLDRQPRQRRRRPRRGGRARVVRLHPGRPRGAEDPRDRRLRHQAGRPCAATTTTSTGSAPSSSAERDWAFVNVNVRPYYAEGSKTLAYEIAEQLGFELPDRVVAPIASGSLFTKIARGFEEWREVGLVEGELPTMNGAQAEGCSPVAQAFEAGWDVCRPVKPDTIAKSLAIGNPADGPYALELARRTRRRDRRGHRRRDPRRHPAARRDHRHLHRDRRRRDHGDAGASSPSAATSARTSASCSSSPARA